MQEPRGHFGSSAPCVPIKQAPVVEAESLVEEKLEVSVCVCVLCREKSKTLGIHINIREEVRFWYLRQIRFIHSFTKGILFV